MPCMAYRFRYRLSAVGNGIRCLFVLGNLAGWAEA